MIWILLLGIIPKVFQSLSLNECLSAFYNDPQCIDQPVGYYCNCGPGFKWNSKQCIAAGVDSKMVFQSVNSSYTVLDRQILTQEFSISFWVRPVTGGVIFSLVHDHLQNENSSQVSISVEPYTEKTFTIVCRYLMTEWPIDVPIVHNRWSHVIWSQKLIGYNMLKWKVYINNYIYEKDVFATSHSLKGEMILGQLSKSFKSISKDYGFSGYLAHFNIWNYSLSNDECQSVYNDCIYNFCGNIAQWSDFRYGTRGNLQLKWPSGIKVIPCTETAHLIRTCDSSCSKRIGAQCKVEIKANIEWERSKANTTVSNPCPMPEKLEISGDNSSVLIDTRPKITRFCEETPLQMGKWKDPDISACISESWQNLLLKQKELQNLVGKCFLNDSYLIDGLLLFSNLTENLSITSAIDLSLCIDILDVFTQLKEIQESKCPRFMIEISQKKEEIHHNQYTTIKLVVKIANNLLDSKNLAAWNYTIPSGFEGRKLLGILNKFYEMTTEKINNLINKYFYMPREMEIFINDPNIGFLCLDINKCFIPSQFLVFKLKAFRWSDFKGAAFPDFEDINEFSDERINNNEIATIALSKDFVVEKDPSQISLNPNHIVIIAVIYRNAALKAAHAIDHDHMKMRTGSIPLWTQRINTDIINIAASIDGRKIEEIKSHSLKIHFLYKDYSNISNINCLSMSGYFRESNIYADRRSVWDNKCLIESMKVESVVCVCNKLGVYAVATDMFNELWKKKKQPNNLLALPSYFGCTVSSMLCSISLLMLIYLRTSSITSSIHKHFSMAIVAGQISYMFGIDKYEHKITCRIFSLSLHYFFLSCFTWLMNEAFNLYIVITYAAHSHGDSTDGHMWRFYALGWIMPAILVAAVAGINKANYYSTNMCWINQKDVWLFYGPAIAVIAVSVLVLIFTAKEHHESSYTKNEKDNKAIINQTKAIWTQIILLTLSWSFAFICVRMQGIIVKYLYGLFNSLQGAFYIVFYYLLNDEVQNIYSNRKSKERKRKPSEQVDDGLHDIPYICYNDAFPNNDRNLDSTQSQDNNENGKDVKDGKKRNFFSNVIENFSIRTRRSQSKDDVGDRSNTDNSDYELITSV